MLFINQNWGTKCLIAGHKLCVSKETDLILNFLGMKYSPYPSLP